MIVPLGASRPAAARSLAGALHDFIDQNATINLGNADTLTPMIERLAARATTLPATSTAPGFSFVFDYETGAPVREAGPMGAVFVERPQTVGRGVLAVGASLLHADLTEFDGSDFADQVSYQTHLVVEGVDVRTRLDFERLSVRSDVVSPFATFGITDRWDVNVLLPLMYTRLDVRARQFGRAETQPEPTTLRDVVGTHEESFGTGEMLVRSKFRLTAPDATLAAASGLTLRMPTGNSADFRGNGDWTLEPFLVGARIVGRFDLHGSLGVEVDAADLQRTRVRYATGTTVTLLESLATFLDVVGSSGVAKDEFTVGGVGFPPQSDFLERFQSRPAERGRGSSFRVFQYVPRTDTVDIAVGAKVLLLKRATAFAGVLVPIVRDGLRADVIPAIGAEYTF